MPHLQVLADSPNDHIAAFVLIGLALLALLAFVALFVAALLTILASPLSGGMKIVWTVFAFCAPFLGSMLWFVVGRPDSRRAAVTAS